MTNSYYWWPGEQNQWDRWSGSRWSSWSEHNYSGGRYPAVNIVVLTYDSFDYALGRKQLSDPPQEDSSRDGDPVTSIKDMAEWQKHWDRAAKYKKLLVYEFYEKNSSLCKAMDKPFRELARRYKGKADFCKLDVDNFEYFARICGVEGAYPTFALFKKCAQVGKVVGPKEDDLDRSILGALNNLN